MPLKPTGPLGPGVPALKVLPGGRSSEGAAGESLPPSTWVHVQASLQGQKLLDCSLFLF